MTKVLVIEDDPHSADIVSRVLARRGYEVIKAGEGLSGLKIAAHEEVDLVLLDLGLPDIGGHTIAALLNRIPGNIPVVAVTASTDAATQRRAMSYGCDGYITKPIDTRTFADQIAAFLNHKEPGEEKPADEPEKVEKNDQAEKAEPDAKPKSIE
jgi:DNA-binding response OmpR family regulator